MVARSVAVLALVLAIAGTISPVAAQEPAPCAVAAAAALAQRGAPYIWGAKGPSAFDCSGLVYWAWAQAGYELGISTYDQARQGVQIGCSLADLHGSATSCWQAGDLIFLHYTGGQHVAMYIGSGLFADAYNRETGVIIHDPSTDGFYQAHFWQSRRIVSCSGVIVNPGSANSTFAEPGLEDLPDLLAPVTFDVPQCGTCNPNGSTYLPETQWDGHWPSGTDALNLPLMFQTAISWLAWRISELLRILICWLLSMLAYVAMFFEVLVNIVVGGINGLRKLLLLFWFALQAWATAIYLLLIDLLDAIWAGLAMLGLILSIILPVLSVILSLIGLILGTLGQFVAQILGVLGWLVGISISLFLAVLAAIGGTEVPTQLVDTYVIYSLLRGGLEGIRDSWFGFVLMLLWALAWIWFVYWISDFFSHGGGEG
jgi:hypothetical protein